MRTLLAGLCLALFACNGASVTGPTPVDPEPVARVQARLPANIYGAFAASEDVPEMAAHGGNVVLVVPSFVDDANVVASALRANGKVAIVSAHHCFGSSKASWAQCWAQTQSWMDPLQQSGLVAAVYVVDEPFLNGIPADVRNEAIAIVRASGYTTVVAEWVQEAIKNGRAPADYFGVTCYMWPGYGSWSMDRCENAYNSHPEWNLVIGQGFDVYEGAGNGDTQSQIARWVSLGRNRSGVIFWVARWQGQTGILDDPALLAAYHKFQ